MSTKPIDLARWGVDGSDGDAANLTVPTSGEKDTGWTLGQDPSSGVFTWLGNRAYRWFKYLSDGALEGSHSIAGTLDVAGDTSITGVLFSFAAKTFTASDIDTLVIAAHGLETGWGPVQVVNSAGALPAGLVVGTDYWVIKLGADGLKLAASFALAVIGTSIDLTTAGTGTNTLVSTASTRTTSDLTVYGTAVLAKDANVANDLQVGKGATVGVDLHVGGDATVAGAVLAANYATAVDYVSVFDASTVTTNNPGGGSGATYTSGGLWTFANASMYLHFPMLVKSGDIIGAWGVYVVKGSAAGNDITVQLSETDCATRAGAVLQTKTLSTNAPGAVFLGDTGGFTVAAGKKYAIGIVSATGSALDSFTDAQITWNR